MRENLPRLKQRFGKEKPYALNRKERRFFFLLLNQVLLKSIAVLVHDLFSVLC